MAGAGCANGSSHTRLGGFETLIVVDAARVDLRGSAGPDDVTVSACSGAVRVLGGNDQVQVGRTRGCVGTPHFTVDGGPGKDRLFGSYHSDDVLIGGPGRDHACAFGGRDVVQAESRC